MALRTWQQEIEPATLYEVRKSGFGADTIQPAIEVIGGAVTIYGSFEEPSAAPAGMYAAATGFQGIDSFKVCPNYLYITGAPTSIVVSGLDVKEVV